MFFQIVNNLALLEFIYLGIGPQAIVHKDIKIWRNDKLSATGQ